MKKLFLLLILTLNSLLLSAQSHITFKGIPVDGHVSMFVEKLEKKGYKLRDKLDSGYVMSGVFTGKEATILVLFSPKTETVWKVGVTFSQDGNDWSTIKNNYLEYKQYYINKYGEPHDDFNFFSSPYKENDGNEIQAIEEDKCHYSCYFELEEGSIAINISSYKNITISYEDAINLKKMELEKSSIIYDDI